MGVFCIAVLADMGIFVIQANHRHKHGNGDVE